jgi:hypothetical protein
MTKLSVIDKALLGDTYLGRLIDKRDQGEFFYCVESTFAWKTNFPHQKSLSMSKRQQRQGQCQETD